MLHPLLQGPSQKRKPLIKPDFVRLDALVARYYPAVYNFASRLVDEPREAALLTHAAFLSVRKQAWRPRDETALIRILLKAVAGQVLQQLEASSAAQKRRPRWELA
jgi:DNA-directed RNA polymerase specialized sigma24 family protein